MADPVLGVLNAMISPAVFVSAAASLILSTSTRLIRVTDRVRDLTEQFERLLRDQDRLPQRVRAEQELILGLLPLLERRTSYLQHAMSVLYLSVALLVLASVLIGIDSALSWLNFSAQLWAALLGVGLLALAGLLLSIEAWLSGRANHQEMAYVRQLAGHFADHLETAGRSG